MKSLYRCLQSASALSPISGGRRCAEQRRKQFLQARYKHICFTRTLSQFFDLGVLHLHLATQEIILSFEAYDIARQVRTGRVLSRLVDGSRRVLSWLFV